MAKDAYPSPNLGFIQVVKFNGMKKRGGVEAAETEPYILPISDIRDISLGKQFHDEAMNRDFETSIIAFRDGDEIEVDAPMSLLLDAIGQLVPVANVDPMANEAVSGDLEESTAAIADAETASDLAHREDNHDETPIRPRGRGRGVTAGA